MKKENIYMLIALWQMVLLGVFYISTANLLWTVVLLIGTSPMYCIWVELIFASIEYKNMTSILKHWLGMR